jgi:hypothetical protein
VLTAAERDEVIRLVASIVGGTPRIEGEDWTPRRGVSRDCPFPPRAESGDWWGFPDVLRRLEAWRAGRTGAAIGIALATLGGLWLVFGFGFLGLPTLGLNQNLHWAVLIFLLGLWFVLAVRTRPASANPIINPTRHEAMNAYLTALVGRGLWLVLVSSVVGEILWLSPGIAPELASYRLYTIWAVFHLILVLTTLARIFDAWQAYSSWNIRVLAVVLFVAAFVLIPSERVGRPVKPPPRYTPPGARPPTISDQKTEI